jgi:phage-related protein
MGRFQQTRLWGFPARVQDNLGFALFLVQTGQHPPAAKPL